MHQHLLYKNSTHFDTIRLTQHSKMPYFWSRHMDLHFAEIAYAMKLVLWDLYMATGLSYNVQIALNTTKVVIFTRPGFAISLMELMGFRMDQPH